MATFQAGDRGRLVDALNLAEELNRSTSVLATLMTSRETDDTTYAADRVTDIRNALHSIDTLQTGLDDPTIEVGVVRKSIPNQFEKEYALTDPQAQTKRIKAKHIDNIKRWLDPRGQLEAYSTTGRVIRTL